jgi:hypothetical protein
VLVMGEAEVEEAADVAVEDEEDKEEVVAVVVVMVMVSGVVGRVALLSESLEKPDCWNIIVEGV